MSNEKEKIWFTADHHWGHANILRFCKRPFKDINHMDEILIKNWNSKVGLEDDIYFLGDFCWRNPRKYVERLNGNIHLLRGSHDKNLGNFSTLFTTVSDLKKIVIEGNVIVVCHYCMRVWQASHFNSWHFFAHSHNRLEPIGKSLDVGVDGHNYFPWSFEEIKKYMVKRPDNFNFVKKDKGEK